MKHAAIVGCLLGTAVGDALGLSYEGLSRKRAAKLFPEFKRYHFFFGKGMISDDTEHSSLVAQALIQARGNETEFARLLAWKLRFWVLGMPAGVGFASLRAIIKLWFGFSPKHSGVFSAGNGAAMRVALLGVCYGHDVEKLRGLVRVATRITHSDPKAEYGALAVAHAAYLASLGAVIVPQTYYESLSTLLANQEADEFLQLVERAVNSVIAQQSTLDFAESLGLGRGISGYVYHTVPLVIHAWLSHQEDYAAAIQSLIRCGGDTDTTAAIAGAILGAKLGKAGIPSEWLANLCDYPRSVSWLEGLGERLSESLEHPVAAYPLPIFPLILRNLLFMLIVLVHGFRRLLLPY
jgi:ADP-ribosylglycohydrolase